METTQNAMKELRDTSSISIQMVYIYVSSLFALAMECHLNHNCANIVANYKNHKHANQGAMPPTFYDLPYKSTC